MKITDAIKSNRERKTISCGVDTLHVTERQTSITLFPDAKISVGNNGDIQNYFQGLNIVIVCRHNGTGEDMIKAFEDAKNLLANAIK